MKSINLMLAVLICSQSFPLMAKTASADVDFKGILVAEPCTLATGGDGENVVVDFSTIPDKNFYYYTPPRTWLQNFHILLKDCDLSLGTKVKVTFTGTEDAEQTGRLAITSSSGVSHVAVGIQENDGTDIAINKQTKSYPLNAGTTELRFKSYIQASSQGVKNHSIGFGKFEAAASFIIEYP